MWPFKNNKSSVDRPPLKDNLNFEISFSKSISIQESSYISSTSKIVNISKGGKLIDLKDTKFLLIQFVDGSISILEKDLVAKIDLDVSE